MLIELRAGRLPLPPMLLHHSWEMLGSALSGEGLGRKYLFELSFIGVKAVKPVRVFQSPSYKATKPQLRRCLWGLAVGGLTRVGAVPDSPLEMSEAWAVN